MEMMGLLITHLPLINYLISDQPVDVEFLQQMTDSGVPVPVPGQYPRLNPAFLSQSKLLHCLISDFKCESLFLCCQC